MVRSVLERVLRVTLDLDAVYSADATAAQEALRVAALEAPEHDFLVRARLWLLCQMRLRCFSLRAALVKVMRIQGLNLKHVETNPNKYVQKSQSLIRLRSERAQPRFALNRRPLMLTTMLILSKLC